MFYVIWEVIQREGGERSIIVADEIHLKDLRIMTWESVKLVGFIPTCMYTYTHPYIQMGNS